ncbi:MAG: acyl carrier protein [Lachnospiraceae bacterium]|nr:acyl carrier protein [Lachnospiraceae bacterium]
MTEEKFLEFIADIMDVDVAEISMDTGYKVYPEWDSLMMLNLIMEIEEEYQVRIPLERVGEIKTLGDMYDMIRK